jgi:hypothetical protein
MIFRSLHEGSGSLGLYMKVQERPKDPEPPYKDIKILNLHVKT